MSCPPDDPYIYPVKFVYYCMFLFYQFQPALRPYYFSYCPSVYVPGLENDFDFIDYVYSTHLLSVLLHCMLGLLILGLYS